MNTRIGHGYDVHQLKDDLPFRLGGVDIPHSKGTLGHSDADVLVHAICDALLGALALGDIGKYFPDTSDDYKGINSLILLEQCQKIIRKNGYEIGNIDSTICLQSPKIAPYIDKMRATLAETLNIDIQQVSVKATTEEKLGFTGREEGISASAVVLIGKSV